MEDFAVISYRNFKFIITKAPTNTTMDNYIRELKKYHTKFVVRVCEPTYDPAPIKDAGIHVYDLTIKDGNFPSEQNLDYFFELLKKEYLANPESCVATHCVSGLGRAPVMVAVALIELGFSYEDAVELIREKRRGAINSKQLDFLAKYKPKARLGNDRRKSCSVQ